MNWQRITGLLLAGAGVLVLSLWLPKVYNTTPATPEPAAKKSGTNVLAAVPPQATNKAGVRTNLPARPIPSPVAAKGTSPSISTNAPASSPPAATNLVSNLTAKYRQLQAHPAFYPVLAVVPLFIGALLLLVSGKSKRGKAAAAPSSLPVQSSASLARRPRARGSVHSCNVLDAGQQVQPLWHFASRGGSFALNREQTVGNAEPLPAGIVSKDWRSLWQTKLNVALLPAQHVFLRVIHLPQSSFEETLAMVELQLEKLSPIPVAQIVWSIHILPQTRENEQTVIVMIVGRNLVEEFLGQLEGRGYMADRLEIPLIDQLQVTPRTGDGAWIYPQSTDAKSTALVAWWYGDALQNLDLLTLPATDRAASLREQLTQMAWAGELEGWLSAPPAWRLVADETAAAEWQPALQEALEQSIEVQAPLSGSELAALTASRAAHAAPQANLLPAEYSTRYQQQFVDRLWMRGLGAVVAIYLVGVGIYMVALQVALYRTRAVEDKVTSLGNSYTNAMQLKARYDVLKERQELKYAALDCWRTVAELLPENVTLEGVNFGDGRRLTLNGSAPSTEVKQLVDFEAALRKAPAANGQPLFDANKGDNLVYRANPGAATVSWNVILELKRGDVQ